MSSEGLQREQSLGGDCHPYPFSAREREKWQARAMMRAREKLIKAPCWNLGEISKHSMTSLQDHMENLPKGKAFAWNPCDTA